ncbi:hypothetical protein, partial [Metasolibacillus meyeri]|uniref:hypothetical protein n=1 Tax=Metasolibacillus meyeri TaxID=1071052 RepID=UPI001EE72F30
PAFHAQRKPPVLLVVFILSKQKSAHKHDKSDHNTSKFAHKYRKSAHKIPGSQAFALLSVSYAVDEKYICLT